MVTPLPSFAQIAEFAKHKIRQGRISSFGIIEDEHISLLSYADDVFVTLKASTLNCLELLDSFEKFRNWTCLHINVSKLSFMVSPRLPLTQKWKIAKCLKFQNVTSWWKHLGIPMNRCRIPSSAFNSFIGKITS